jgi:predicted mannosyl-3-phosphoglycerate phosphatase (HAD superfamily)
MNKPLFLVDLDDTLFQTMRKISEQDKKENLRVGAIDLTLQPRSFMTEEQSLFVDWLLNNAELIPVTARGTSEIARVSIPYSSWAITTHGAVILKPDGTPDVTWKNKILSDIAPLQNTLLDLQSKCEELLSQRGINGFARINYEYDDQPIYLVMKHRNSAQVQEIYDIAKVVTKEFDLSGFYVHSNSNNIAWLPKCVEKGLATEYLLNQIRTTSGPRPVIGLGDSISDHTFLKHCSWWGVPKKSQFANLIQGSIDAVEIGVIHE